MSYLVPDKIESIPVSPYTEGHTRQKLAVNIHHFPVKGQKKLVFLFSHSNGFHKECFHPIMKRLLKQYQHLDVTFVSWDARNHGDSALLNQGTFDPSFSWIDNAMDTKQVIDYFNLTEYDQLIGVGHSFGATSMLLLEFHFPQTFDGLCILEPILCSFMIEVEMYKQHPILTAAKRRDEWKDREECKASLLKKDFFKSFSPEVLDLYVQYGMYETDKGTIKLKCPKEQEAHVFLKGIYPAFMANTTMFHLKVPTVFVIGKGSENSTPPFDKDDLMHSENKNLSLHHIDGSHMVPNENPDIIIPEINFIVDQVNKSQIKPKL